jgi:hypothetical protein
MQANWASEAKYKVTTEVQVVSELHRGDKHYYWSSEKEASYHGPFRTRLLVEKSIKEKFTEVEFMY